MADFLNCSEKALNVTGGKMAFDMSNQGSDIAAGAIIPAAKKGDGADKSALGTFEKGKLKGYGNQPGVNGVASGKSGTGADLNFGQFSSKKPKTYGAPTVPNESNYAK